MKSSMTSAWMRIGVGMCIACWISPLQAFSSEVLNGDFMGTNVRYLQVRQNSQTDPIVDPADPGPYGEPMIVDDDVLSFGTPNFAAIADPSTEFDATDGFLAFTLEANPGYAIPTLDLYEFGAIQMHSNSGGSLETWTNVIAPVFVEVKDLVLADGTPDGLIVPVPEPLFIKSPIPVSPLGSSPPGWNSMDDIDVTQWIATMEIDLVQRVLDEFPDIDAQMPLEGVARLDLTMNNILTAAVEDTDSFAFVDKKHTDVRPGLVVVGVPEPAGVFIVFATVAAMIAHRRRMELV